MAKPLDKQLGDLLSFGRVEPGRTGVKTFQVPSSSFGDFQINGKIVGDAWGGIRFTQPWNPNGSNWTIMLNSNAAGLYDYQGFYSDTLGWRFYCTEGQMYATAFNPLSDRRLKNDITPLPSVLDKFNRLKPCTFTWKDNPGKEIIGLIAQEVIPLFPKAVVKGKDPFMGNPQDQIMSVDLMQLLTICIKAVQELSDKIDSLEQQMNIIR